MIVPLHVASTRLERVSFSSPVLCDTSFGGMRGQGPLEGALGRAKVFRGADYTCTMRTRYQGPVCYRVYPFDLSPSPPHFPF